MTSFDFFILFSHISCILFFGEAQVSPPHDGKTLIFLPGSNGKIQWSLPGAVIVGVTRFWTFTSRDGLETTLLRIIDDREPEDLSEGLLAINVEKPTTLVLNNVNDSYNGIYKFRFLPKSGKESRSNVFVYIAKKPTVTFSCSSPVSRKEGENFTCKCLAKNGNPAPNVTWHKDGKQIYGIGKNNQTLELNNVNPKNDGTYTCKAESYPDEKFTDEKSIKVTVKLNQFRPRKPNITFSQEIAKVDEPLNITCESEGLPEPSFTITHNNTQVIAEKTYNIPQVKWSDGGLYQCTAKNKLGSNSKCYCLTVSGEATSSQKATRDMGDTVVVWHIVVSLISGIVIGCLLSYIVSYSCRKFRIRSRKPQQSNPEPSKSQVDKTYQELDLTKMNTVDRNYQSLRVNQSAKNDNGNENDSTYTELSQTREAENSYQSLT